MSKYESGSKKSFKEMLPTILKFVAAIAVLASIIALAVVYFQPKDKREDSKFAIEAQASYNATKGPQDADVALMYFVDYQCPACRANAPIMEEVADSYDDRVLFIYKHLPLESIHIFARQAAASVQAAGEQDAYFEYANKVYDLQDTGFSSKALTDLALEIGLDVDQFESDKNSSSIKDQVQFDLDDLEALDLSSCSKNGSLSKDKDSLTGVGTPLSVLYKDDKIIDCWSGGIAQAELESKLSVALGETQDQAGDINQSGAPTTIPATTIDGPQIEDTVVETESDQDAQAGDDEVIELDPNNS